jgi:hypothetical protein
VYLRQALGMQASVFAVGLVDETTAATVPEIGLSAVPSIAEAAIPGPLLAAGAIGVGALRWRRARVAASRSDVRHACVVWRR